MLERESLFSVAKKLGRPLQPGEKFKRENRLTLGKGMIGQISIPIPAMPERFGPTFAQNYELMRGVLSEHREEIDQNPNIHALSIDVPNSSALRLHIAEGLAPEQEREIVRMIPGVEVRLSRSQDNPFNIKAA